MNFAPAAARAADLLSELIRCHRAKISLVDPAHENAGISFAHLAQTPASAMLRVLHYRARPASQKKEAGPLRDLAIIGAAQRVEHYEISANGTARAIAEQIGNTEIAALLAQTEDEEKAADEKLSEVAKGIYAGEPKEEEEEEPEDIAEPAMAGNGRSRSSRRK